MGEQWIEVVGWDRFQHYRDRAPLWIKNYTSLLHDPAYASLTWAQRGILHALWLEYAASRREVVGNTAGIGRALGGRVTGAQLKALVDAGFIRISASKPLATCLQAASPEVEVEVDRPLPTADAVGIDYIVCRQCGERTKPRAPCWACGANPRAAGTNPRTLVERRRDSRHAQLIADAQKLAAGWNGGSSLAFDDQLDNLETSNRSTFSASERLALWDEARTR